MIVRSINLIRWVCWEGCETDRLVTPSVGDGQQMASVTYIRRPSSTGRHYYTNHIIYTGSAPVYVNFGTDGPPRRARPGPVRFGPLVRCHGTALRGLHREGCQLA